LKPEPLDYLLSWRRGRAWNEGSGKRLFVLGDKHKGSATSRALSRDKKHFIRDYVTHKPPEEPESPKKAAPAPPNWLG
jgi:hypothetical protein